MSAQGKDSIILLIHCKDRKGIVARVSGFIHDFGGNILDSDHHTDEETNDFLMRMEFATEGFQVPSNDIPADEPVSASWFRNKITVWPIFFSGTAETNCTLIFPSSSQITTPARAGLNSSKFPFPSIPSRRRPSRNRNDRSWRC